MNKGAKNSRAVRNGQVVVEAGVVAQPTGDIPGGGACTMASGKGEKGSGPVALNQYRYSLTVTQVYADISPEQSIAGMNAMERLMGSLGRAKKPSVAEAITA